MSSKTAATAAPDNLYFRLALTASGRLDLDIHTSRQTQLVERFDRPRGRLLDVD